MRAKKLLTVAVLVGVLGLLPFFSASAAVYSKPHLYVVKSASIITSNDIISIAALASSAGASSVDKITLTVGNSTIVCEDAFYCQKVAGPFAVTKNTVIKYKVVAEVPGAKNVSLKSINSGSFLVKPVKKLSVVPQYTKITTSNNKLEVGESIDLKIYTKDDKGISNINILLDGDLVGSCSEQAICGTTIGPFGEDQVGEHKYIFVVTDVDGNKIEPWGKFSVSSKISEPTESDLETGVADNYKYTCLDSDDLVGSGDVFLRPFTKGKVTYGLYWNDNPAVSLAVDGEDYCIDTKTVAEFSCDGKLKPTGSLKGGYFAIPTNYTCANGCKDGACMTEPSPASDKILPVITVSADKASAGDNDVITFTAKASDNKKVTKINILVNAVVVKDCYDTNVCEFTGGPYPTYAGTSVSYGANAYDEAGNRGWTGYQYISIAKAVATDNYKYTCLDSDDLVGSGDVFLRPFTKGKVTYGLYWNDNPAVSLAVDGEDYCIDTKTVAEFSCDGKLKPTDSPKGGYLAIPTNYTCVYGCTNGACNVISSPVSASTLTLNPATTLPQVLTLGGGRPVGSFLFTAGTRDVTVRTLTVARVSSNVDVSSMTINFNGAYAMVKPSGSGDSYTYPSVNYLVQAGKTVTVDLYADITKISDLAVGKITSGFSYIDAVDTVTGDTISITKLPLWGAEYTSSN